MTHSKLSFASLASWHNNCLHWSIIPCSKTPHKQHHKNRLSFNDNVDCHLAMLFFPSQLWLNYAPLMIIVLFYPWNRKELYNFISYCLIRMSGFRAKNHIPILKQILCLQRWREVPNHGPNPQIYARYLFESNTTPSINIVCQ